MIYVDTSALVALLTHEPATVVVANWFAGNQAALISADWCRVEFASALAAKQRAKRLRAAHARRAHQAFDTLLLGGLRLLPLTRSACARAADLCAPQASLRAGDALHLAVALEASATGLAGLDSTMNRAARKLGLRLVIAPQGAST